MAWFERMNEALDYIEDHLLTYVDMTEVAKITCCSISSFQRMFSAATDVSLSEYIRRRKLTLAAFELQHSSMKIVDLALKYGYDSPEAFTRAFNIIHGKTPSAAREQGVTLTAYPRISFLLTVRGAVAMNYRIESKEAFVIYGIEEMFSMENGENLRVIPQFWQAAHQDGRIDKLIQSTNMLSEAPNKLCLVNAIFDYRSVEEEQTFPYMLFAYKTNRSDTQGYREVTVSAGTWAIFRTENHTMEKTDEAIQDLIKRVYTEWLPTADYEKIDGCDMELYYNCGSACWSEIWIRVRSK
ncbi:AraC family transcriptional regulator [Paenibacillus massiliensis]|uniref:AraC family transcriptional regulator n=1 Tax=Paenibacillus massiliensis TaxID=225917 RepID=UPI000470AC07|nr:AraC family transcriptional regulator [Paenibacillus massiliensis]